MTAYTYSLVMTCPAASLAESNRLPELMGYGPGSFSVPLGETEDGPVTRYGLCTRAKQAFIDLLTAAQGGTMPAVPGMTEAEVGAVLGGYATYVEPADRRPDVEHFIEAVAPLVVVQA